MFAPAVCDDIFAVVNRIFIHYLGIGSDHRCEGITVDIQSLEIAQAFLATEVTREADTVEVNDLHEGRVAIEEDITSGVIAMEYATLMQGGSEAADSLQDLISVAEVLITDEVVELMLAG